MFSIGLVEVLIIGPVIEILTTENDKAIRLVRENETNSTKNRLFE